MATSLNVNRILILSALINIGIRFVRDTKHYPLNERDIAWFPKKLH